ncbi:MAG: amidohydrolase family protein [Chloroflexota bacterium]
MSIISSLTQFSNPLQAYALVNGLVFDSLTGRALAGQAVVIEDAVIRAICPQAELEQDTPQVDISGQTLLPGLVDVHVHSEDWHAPLFLAHGVTAVRDTGSELNAVLNRRARWNVSASAPRLVCTGPVIDRPGSTWEPITLRVNTPQDARAAVDRLIDAGVDQIKTYVMLDLPCYKAIIDQAHRRGKFVVSHLGRYVDARQAAEAGVNEIEHLSGASEALWWERNQASPDWIWMKLWADMDLERANRLIDVFIERGVWLAITRLMWERMALAADPRLMEHPQRKYLPSALARFWEQYMPHNLAKRSYPKGMPPPTRAARCQQAAGMAIFTAQLAQRGARILIGTDAPLLHLMPGFSFQDELLALWACGFSETALLQAATWGGAQALGLEAEIGSIQPGKQADLLLVAGDPTASLSAMQHIQAVARLGSWQNPAVLLQQAKDYVRLAPEHSSGRLDDTY